MSVEKVLFTIAFIAALFTYKVLFDDLFWDGISAIEESAEVIIDQSRSVWGSKSSRTEEKAPENVITESRPSRTSNDASDQRERESRPSRASNDASDQRKRESGIRARAPVATVQVEPAELRDDYLDKQDDLHDLIDDYSDDLDDVKDDISDYKSDIYEESLEGVGDIFEHNNRRSSGLRSRNTSRKVGRRAGKIGKSYQKLGDAEAEAQKLQEALEELRSESAHGRELWSRYLRNPNKTRNAVDVQEFIDSPIAVDRTRRTRRSSKTYNGLITR